MPLRMSRSALVRGGARLTPFRRRSKPNGIRLGYMGHMVLIAEEVVKLFARFPEEIHEVVRPHIPEPAWSAYCQTTLRETRERDLLQLGGGISMVPQQDTASTASGGGLSDEDDEFPMNSQRALRALEAGGQAGGGSPTDEGAFGGHARASTSIVEGEPGSSDQVCLSVVLPCRFKNVADPRHPPVLSLPPQRHLERPPRQVWKLGRGG